MGTNIDAISQESFYRFRWYKRDVSHCLMRSANVVRREEVLMLQIHKRPGGEYLISQHCSIARPASNTMPERSPNILKQRLPFQSSSP